LKFFIAIFIAKEHIVLNIYKENENAVEINSTLFTGRFDKKLKTDALRLIAKDLLNGNIVKINKDVVFDENGLKLFAKFLVTSTKELSLVTDNAKLLIELNQSIAKDVEKVLIIDTHNWYHRNFHALPRMYSSKGVATTLLKALFTLIKWINASEYTHVVFATESSQSFRVDYTKTLLGDEKCYKANRSETDPELKAQIKLCESFLSYIGYKPLAVTGYEADDVIASLADQLDLPVCVLSADKDLNQLFVYPNFRIIDVKTKKLLDETHVLEKFGVSAESFIDYQALVGDTSDNIPGVPGIGSVWALKLLERFGSFDGIVENIESIDEKGVKAKVIDGAESGRMSKDLVFLRRDLLSGFDISKYSKNVLTMPIITDIMSTYEIK
jgi:5'-3' exonuclease